MNIEVTEKDIRWARPEIVDNCPFGRSIMRHDPRIIKVRNLGTHLELYRADNDIMSGGFQLDRIVDLPEEAQQRLYLFDKRRGMKPFTLEL